MKQDELDRLWKDPSNWRLGSIYVSPDDPRIVVAKRLKWTGWTFNFAHGLSIVLLVVVMAVAAGPTMIVIAMGVVDQGAIMTVLLGSTLAVFLLTWWAGKKGRE